ncbi:XrtA/PEP-CTERM system exopolysaccharide export protein [Thiospirillum jenense]|uniref:XrtA/PEP-CTERM system exopolysaccharide export protein n=1 Tax=Thiospirillum jenense TaxID=1653858 RepID=UPI003B8357FE
MKLKTSSISTCFIIRSLSITVVFFSFITITSCGLFHSQHSEVPPEQRQIDVQKDYFYQIAPGDIVDIFVWGIEELSGSVPVRPDGMLTTRLAEDMPASGKTPSQLARDLEKQFATYVRAPIVTITVNGFTGLSSQQVRVIGEAAKPFAVPFRKHMTLLDVMIAVGGLTEFAAGNKAVLVRTLKNKPQSYALRINDLIRDGDISANLSLLPGDVIIIPEAWF